MSCMRNYAKGYLGKICILEILYIQTFALITNANHVIGTEFVKCS